MNQANKIYQNVVNAVMFFKINIVLFNVLYYFIMALYVNGYNICFF